MTTEATDAIQFEFSSDPKPAQKLSSAKPQPPAGKRGPGRPAKSTVQKELAEPIAMMIKIGCAPILFRDPVCGGAIMQQADELADALAAQAMDSPRLRKWLELMQSPGGWMNVGIAAWPIIFTVYQHHMVRQPEGEETPAEHVHQGVDFSQFNIGGE